MKLLSMKLTNFKGIRDLTLDFPDGGNYNIYGTNGAGKTTIVDALIWLLFDKDSTDDKRKIIDVIAERKARLFAQVDEMKAKQEEVDKNNWEEFWASKGVGRHLQ